jgi:uncharacterized protein (DUF305 family)
MRSDMNTKMILTALAGLVVGVAGTMVATSDAFSSGKGAHHMADANGNNESIGGMHGAMVDMMEGLSGKTGDEFDKAFLAGMIVYHEGAIDMAEAARTHANHAELKDMAKAIISAQSLEISQMKAWQKSWYGI